MLRYEYPFTYRMKRIIELASQLSKVEDIIYPHHLFVAACQEATGVCGELHLYMHKKVGPEYVNYILSMYRTKIDEPITLYKNLKLSKSAVLVFDKANEKKEAYNQVLINEGHLLQSIFMTDEQLIGVLNRDVVKEIMNIACLPRDLIVDLKRFTLSEFCDYQISIRRATAPDLSNLREFIRVEFGERWLEHIDRLRIKDHLPIFIAEDRGVIIGFACYDIVRNKKGVFGPMGTSKNTRLHSVGKGLLYRSLSEMANIGYEYAIIGQAGPIEFYERVCDAKIIPRNR